jgi:four helix bundle protein
MEQKKYLKLNDIEAYKVAFNLSNYVWDVVIKWEHFAKITLGEQLVKAVDSISENIAEGFGRYSKRDKIRFYRISYGSLFESLDENEKAKKEIWLKKKIMIIYFPNFKNCQNRSTTLLIILKAS